MGDERRLDGQGRRRSSPCSYRSSELPLSNFKKRNHYDKAEISYCRGAAGGRAGGGWEGGRALTQQCWQR